MKVATRALTAGALAFGLSLGGGQALAESWDMPTPYPDATFHTQNITQFAEEVEELTEGALTITVHPAGSLYGHPEIKGAVRGGQVQIGEFLLSRLAPENAVYQVDSVPFLATDYDQAMKLWQVSQPVIEDLLAQENLMVLYSVPWPPQGLYTEDPVESGEDLEGIAFRAYNDATERLAQLAGMTPTQVEVPDIPQAFATGRVDAMITSPSTGVNSKAWDFANHFYHLQAWLPKNVVVVNQRAFDGLDPTVQEAVLRAAEQAMDRGWEMSRQETIDQLEVLEENGMQVHREPPEPLSAFFQEIGHQMADDWLEAAGEPGKDILEAYDDMM